MQKLKTPLTTILLAGFLAGLLDGLAAVIQYIINTGENPERVFYFIASGVFGPQAFTAGKQMILWGLFFHFLIAFIFAAFYFILYPKLSLFSKNKVLAGFVYGFFVWLVMNLIVLPLSNAPQLPFEPIQALIGILIHMFLVGLPISILAHRYYATALTGQAKE